MFLCFNGLKIGVFVLRFGAHKFVISEYHPISFQVFSITAHGMHLWIVQKEFIFLETLEL